MDRMRRDVLLNIGTVFSAMAVSAKVLAQPVPELAKLLCGFPPGGTSDGVARRLADGLRGQSYARQVYVENKVGASGRIAFDEMRRAAPDGSVMVLQPETTLTLQPLIDPRNTVFRFEDGQPVAGCGVVYYGLSVGPMVPESVRTVKDFLDWAKANPAQASFGSPGAGSPYEFCMKLLSKETGVALSHVPYRGSAPGVQELIGGQLAAMYSPVGDALPHKGTGRMRLLATSGERRSRFAQDVPTFTEQGMRFMEASEWYGLWMPKAASEAVVTRAAAAVKTVMAQPETQEIFNKLAVEPRYSPTPEFAKAMRDSLALWQERVRLTGFKPEA